MNDPQITVGSVTFGPSDPQPRIPIGRRQLPSLDEIGDASKSNLIIEERRRDDAVDLEEETLP